MNLRLLIEYDGSLFRGWQKQRTGLTIQGTLESIIERIANQKIPLTGASRTDSGVHAKGQVANFHTELDMSPMRWRMAFNAWLPPSIRILECVEVPDSFHAQKDAVSKIYEYRVLNRRVGSALDPNVYFYPGKLDWDKIRKTLPYFVGEKDFKSFQAARSDVQTSVRTIHRFELHEDRPGELYRFEIEGSGFLKQMVRTLVGTLLEVGEGKTPVEAISAIIEAKDRREAGRTVPAKGLCLTRIFYKENETGS